MTVKMKYLAPHLYPKLDGGWVLHGWQGFDFEIDSAHP